MRVVVLVQPLFVEVKRQGNPSGDHLQAVAGKSTYTGSATQLARATPKLTVPRVTVCGSFFFDHKFVGLLVITLTKTLIESGQDLSPGLSDLGGEWLGLVPSFT